MKAIPFSMLPTPLLRKISPIFNRISSRLAKRIPHFETSLELAEIKFSPVEYLSMCMASAFFFIIFGSIIGIFIFSGGTEIVFNQLPTGMVTADAPPSETPLTIIGVVALIAIFMFIQQIMRPKLKAHERIKNIDRNLIPALQHLLVQLNSGAPVFEAITSVSAGNYGEVSNQFKIAIRHIHAGKGQIQALEKVAEENPSPYFRRAIWQITTGMKTGSDITKILKGTIKDLSEEQLIQIQRYGSQLNPLAMFYMLIAVILPALGITFIMVLSAFTNLSSALTKLIFWGLLVSVLFFQIMFLGVIKARRPNLLE